MPTSYWDIHTFSPTGQEIIVSGEHVWSKDATAADWKKQTLKEFFGEDFPLEKEVEEKQKVESEMDRKKYDLVKDKVMVELRKFFRPELINRFDEVIIFEPLRFQDMMKIVKLQLKGVGKLLEDQEMGFSYTEAAVKEIVRSGFDPIYGARPLRRAIQKLVENPISTLIIEQKVKPGDAILVDFDGESFVFNVEKVELVTGAEAKQTTKQFMCEVCANKFKTEVKPNATTVCTKCASTKVQEIAFSEEQGMKTDQKADEQKPAEEKPVEEKPAEPAIPPVTTPPTIS